jgi:DNA-binding MarR family transcriptional regulator
MKNYALLSQLIGVLEEIENQREESTLVTLEDFAHYILRSLSANKEHGKKIEFAGRYNTANADASAPENRLSNEINKQLVLLSRLIRTLAKQAFTDTPLQTVEEFSYLAILRNMQSAGKSELIELNYQEKTTGTEVIKRLLNNDLVSQFDDKLDKRSKRVQITNKGERLINLMYDEMTYVAELVVSPLNDSERQSLLSMLHRLENFHQHKQNEFRLMNMEKIKDYLRS